jgi:hypothetical protein
MTEIAVRAFVQAAAMLLQLRKKCQKSWEKDEVVMFGSDL